MTPNTLVVCAVLLSLASCTTSPPRDRDPTWALIQNPTDSQPPYVWRRADELPVTTRTVLTGQALAPPSAFAAYWPPPGPIASIHGFRATVISRPERGQTREVLAQDAEECRKAAHIEREEAPQGAMIPSSSGVLVDGEVASLQSATEKAAVRRYSDCMNQRGYSVATWWGQAGL
jgi:hypothetical protein